MGVAHTSTMRTPSSVVDRRITEVVGPGGVVRDVTLRRAGVCPDSVEARHRSGWLVPGGRGLHVVAHLRNDLTPTALVQAKYPDAAAAARTAAWFYDFDGFDRYDRASPHPDHVIARPPKRPVPGLRRGSVEMVQNVRGLRVLTPLATLESLASVVDLDALEAAVECALRRKLVTEADLDHGMLDLVMRRRGRGIPPTESYLETLTIQRVLRPAGIAHRRQVPVWVDGQFVMRCDFELDSGLLLEVDGAATHATPIGVQRDNWHAMTVRLGGRDVEHLTWNDVTQRPRATARRIARLSRQVADRTHVRLA
jgi:hypothetical protein